MWVHRLDLVGKKGDPVALESKESFADELARLAQERAELEGISFPHPSRAQVITVANQKGGVGKTTSAVNLAVALAQGGLKVIVIDSDPQGNASTALGIDHQPEVPSTYDVLRGDKELADCLYPSEESENLLVCPATIDLSGAELELSSAAQREYILRRALEIFLSVHRDVDVIIVDCPPSLGLLTLNAFVAADQVLVPIQAEYYALEGLSMLLGTIERIKEYLHPKLDIGGILITMFDRRTNLSSEVAEEIRRYFPEQVFKTVVPRSVKLSEAPSFGMSIFGHDPRGAAALAYKKVALELANRMAGK